MKYQEQTISEIRRFNRFYTVKLGFLNKNYLDTAYSVTETRILFELYEHEGITANHLIDLLKLDKSYISRTIRSLEKNGIVERRLNPSDARSYVLSLTEQGILTTDELICATNTNIRKLIQNMDANSCRKIRDAMCLIINTLSSGNRDGEEK